MRSWSSGAGWPGAWWRSLTGRLVLAMLAVAAVALLLAALLTSPLVRSATEESARATLSRQADLLAAASRPAPLVNRLDLRADVRGVYLGSLGARGRAVGVATALTGADRRRLLAGTPVSATVRGPDGTLLVEARPTRGGGAIVLAADTGTVDEAVTAQRERLLLALSLALLVALAVGVVVARQLGRPLVRLAADARDLRDGRRGTVATVSGARELEDVAAALRQLDDALATSEDRQRRFLLSVSHELRTPLTAVRGYAESLADGVVPPEDLPEVAATMVRESDRLARYVADLLDLARMEADELVLRPGACDAAGLVEEAGRAWVGRAERARLELRVETPGGPLPVRTDPVRLRQVLDALVDNAVRVCPAGSLLVLAAAAAPDGGGVRIEVRDSGPGLTEEDAAVAFRPGALHERYADRAGGLGLGLALVHGLVARLGGTIRVGRAPEGGAAFRVELPAD